MYVLSLLPVLLALIGKNVNDILSDLSNVISAKQ